MVIKGNFKYLKWEDKQKVSFFFLTKAKAPVWRRKGRRREEEEEEEEGEEGEEQRYVFFLWNQVSFGCLGLLV